MYHLCTTNTTNQKTALWNKNCSNFTVPWIGYENHRRSVAETMRITSMISYSIIMALSVLGNSAIIGIVLRNKSMRTKANVLIVNMAISDLLVTLFALPRRLYVVITKSYQWDTRSVLAEAVCKLAPFVREVSCAVSIFSMVAIAMDRFYAIVNPWTQKPRLLKHKFVIPGIWVAAMAANALYLYAFQLSQYSAGVTLCLETLTNQQQQIFDTFRFVAFIAVPLFALIYFYTTIAFTMARRPTLGATARHRRQNKKIVKLAVTIVVFFFISWTPFYIFLLLDGFERLQFFQRSPHNLVILFVLHDVFTIMTYASFAINPIICLVFSSNFRKHIYSLRINIEQKSTLTQQNS